MERAELYRRWQRRESLTPQQLAELFVDSRPLTAADIAAGQRLHDALTRGESPKPGSAGVCDAANHLAWVGPWMWTGRPCPCEAPHTAPRSLPGCTP